MSTPRKIRWLIAHHPEYLFIRTAEKFREELNKLCPNEFDIEIYTTKSYVEKFGKFEEITWKRGTIAGLEIEDNSTHTTALNEDNPKWEILFDALKNDEFEISQVPVTLVGNMLDKDYQILDMPFIFNDHDHVNAVLDNEIGNRLSNQLVEKTGIRGLAFTYSGGYRVIGSQNKINNLEEMLSSMMLAYTQPGKVLFSNLGIKTFIKSNDEISNYCNENEINKILETTYLRFAGKHILKTEHSVFMTTILTGENFYNSLTEKQKEAFSSVAKETAKAERQWSIEDAEKYENEAESKGISIIHLSTEDQEKLRKSAKLTYFKLKQLGYNVELIKSIIDKGNTTLQ